MREYILGGLACLYLLISLLSCQEPFNEIRFSKDADKVNFESPLMRLAFDNRFGLKVYRKSGMDWISMTDGNQDPYTVNISGQHIDQFKLDQTGIVCKDIVNDVGTGKRLTMTGLAEGPLHSVIEKTMTVELYQRFPEAACIKLIYRNISNTPGLTIEEEIDNNFKLDATLINSRYDRHAFWILQGGSYRTRPDWIQPVTDDFSYENFQGQDREAGVYGGGLPVLDIWCKESGLFVGSISSKPLEISLPARVDDLGYLDVRIAYKPGKIDFANEPYHSIPLILGVHQGDFYNGLRKYAQIMAKNGFEMMSLKPSHPAYEAIWCGWGFGPDFTIEQMVNIIPLLHEFNFKVVTVDLGWFYKNGDYIPRDDRFPNGDEDMRKFVKIFHDNGFKIKVWITTHIAGPQLQKEHPEWLVRDKDGNPVYFDNYNSRVAYLCPALEEVREYHKNLVKKCIGDWDYDGFKVDQQLINAVADCYASGHQHAYPAESLESLPDLYKIISEETVKLKPEAIIEVCPCGVFPSFYKMPYYNQPVSSDFNTTWQIRHRGKTIKALMGPEAAFYGDHAERHYRKSNFASMLGVGGIPGTMFVSREEDNVEFLRVKYPCYLSPERKQHYKKWFDLYNTYQLSKGKYLNLYDIAYDLPETHVVKKDGILYYAFYAPKWNDDVLFRGLEDKEYSIIDYVNNKELGMIRGNGKLSVMFEDYLLVKAVPVN